MPFIALFMGKGPSGFGHGSTADEVLEGVDLKGRTMLVTGCNSGLGTETIRALAARGARVFATARTQAKAKDACAPIAGAVPLECELSEPASVRGCIEAIQKDGAKLDAIVCNAGIMALPKLEKLHGYEAQFFTNHIGHFLLVTGLLDRLAPEGRVVMVSSSAHKGAPKAGIEFDNLTGERGYGPWKAYGQSKIANILFAKELAKRLPKGQTANALHPGVIKTNLVRSMSPVARGAMVVFSPIFLKAVAQGAATQCYVAAHPKAAGVTGEFFADCNIAASSERSRDADLAKRLWEESERIVAKLGEEASPPLRAAG